MNNRKETERAKYVQEKCQNLLTDMLRDEDNKYCVDCDAKGPRWASFNLGVFLCIRCAGIHRNLGVHISRVKSVNLDSWTPDQVVSLQQMGNSRARAVYEAQLPDGFRRPQTDSALESFVRAKYEHKKYMAREWVQPPPPKANWDKEIDDEMERQKRKKKTGGAAAGLSTNLGGLPVNSSLTTKHDKSKLTSSTATTATAKVSIPAPLPKPKGHAGGSPKTSNRIHGYQQTTNKQTTDLLGLDTIVSTSPLSGTSAQINTGSTSTATIDTHKNDDVFSNFLSAPPPSSATQNLTNPSGINDGTTNNNGNALSNEMALAKEEQDFFNQIPTESDKIKMTKDSIMALYDTMPQSTPGQLINNNNNNNNNINLGQYNPTNFNGSTVGMQFLPPQQLQQQQQPHLQQQFLNQNQFNGFSTNFPTNFPVVATGMMPSTAQQFNVQSLTTTLNAGSGLATTSGGLFSTIPIQHIPSNNNNNNNNSMGIHPSATTIPGNTNSNINQQFGNLNLGNVWQ